MATLPTTETKEITEEETGLGTGKDFEAEVIVYNCDCHTYQHEKTSIGCLSHYFDEPMGRN